MVQLLLLMFFFLGCGRDNQPQPRKQELHTCLKTDPSSLDPRACCDAASETVVRLLFTGLTDFDRGHKARLALAESYQISNEGKTYTFVLKKSVWSDGTPLTAYDFEIAAKEVLKPNFKEVKALDARTLAIDLENPDPSFLTTLAERPLYPIPKHLQKDSLNRHRYIACGPFKLQSHEILNQLILEKNPHYWDVDNVRLEKIYFYIIKESFTALMMFDHGELDWIGVPLTEITADTLGALKKSCVLKMAPFPAIQQPYLKDVFPMADFKWAYLETREQDQHRHHATDGTSRSS
jgi:oligopeptide transport system substrate-binding protein